MTHLGIMTGVIAEQSESDESSDCFCGKCRTCRAALREEAALQRAEKPKELHPFAAKILRGEPLFEDSKPEPRKTTTPRKVSQRKRVPKGQGKGRGTLNAESRQRMLAKRIRKDGKWFHPDAPHGEIKGCSYYQCYCELCYTAYKNYRASNYPRPVRITKKHELTWGVKLPEVKFPKQTTKRAPKMRNAIPPKVKRVRLPEVKFPKQTTKRAPEIRKARPPKVKRVRLPEVKFKPPRPENWHRRDAYVYKLTPEENEARIARNKRTTRDRLLAERVEIDGRKVHPRATHGTVKGARYYCCMCIPCNKAWYQYRKTLRKKK